MFVFECSCIPLVEKLWLCARMFVYTLARICVCVCGGCRVLMHLCVIYLQTPNLFVTYTHTTPSFLFVYFLLYLFNQLLRSHAATSDSCWHFWQLFTRFGLPSNWYNTLNASTDSEMKNTVEFMPFFYNFHSKWWFLDAFELNSNVLNYIEINSCIDHWIDVQIFDFDFTIFLSLHEM